MTAVAVAVRQATRAPEERPPLSNGRPASGAPAPAVSAACTASHASSSFGAGGADRRPATQ